MKLANHDIYTATIAETVAFCTRIESEKPSESSDDSPVPRKKKKKQTKYESFIPCEIHGNLHDNRDCHNIKRAIAHEKRKFQQKQAQRKHLRKR